MTYSDEQWGQIHLGLAAPFPEDEIGSVPVGGGQKAAFINARSVQERLDAIVGPGGWSFSWEVVDADNCAVKGTLAIHGVAKSDVGYPNAAADADTAGREPLKAAVSDAFKRAAVHWGVGRGLYPKPGPRPSGQTRPPATKPAAKPAAKPAGAEGDREAARALLQSVAAAQGRTAADVFGELTKALEISDPDPASWTSATWRSAKAWLESCQVAPA